MCEFGFEQETVMTNTNITLADKLADKIKNSEIGTFMTEDDLLPLARDAIHKAFFEPEDVRSSHGYSTGVRKSKLVQLAEDEFKDAIKLEVKKIVDEMVKQPEFKTAIAETIAISIPAILTESVQTYFHASMINIKDDAVRALVMKMKMISY